MTSEKNTAFVLRAMRVSNCDSRADEAVAKLLAAAKAALAKLPGDRIVNHGDASKCPDVIAGRGTYCQGHLENNLVKEQLREAIKGAEKGGA